MKKALIMLALTLIIGSAYAAESFVSLKCDKDAYAQSTSPDTNFGAATELDSQTKFTFDGTVFSNRDNRIAYFHFIIPPELIGKVKVIEATTFVHVNFYKAISPYKAGLGVFAAGLYPILSSWDEMTLTYNNSPGSSGPAFYSATSITGIYKPVIGYNQLKLGSYGVQLLQKLADTGSSNGMSLFVDVYGTVDTDPLKAGDYFHLLRIASRDTGKKAPYILMGYETITGNMINGSNVNTASLGEVKAKYH